MPLTNNTSHLNHEAVTKHTWSPNNDTIRYEASGSATYKPDLFQHGEASDTPHISEYTYSNGDPKEWADRVRNMTVVHTGGLTNTAVYTHHTVSRPKFPPGSISLGNFTLSQYLPTEDAAVRELHMVAEKVKPALPTLITALEAYHLHTPDGWITTAGFMACCNKTGFKLQRNEFLALERSVPKDAGGRFNFYHIREVIEAISAANASEDLSSTAPEAVLQATGSWVIKPIN